MEYVGSPMYSYRSNPNRAKCAVAILPRPPDPIVAEDIMIDEFVLLDDVFSLTMEWIFPQATYGTVKSSEILILLPNFNSTIAIPDDITLIDADLIISRILVEVMIVHINIPSHQCFMDLFVIVVLYCV